MKLASWELTIEGSGVVSTNIPWFRSVEAQTRRFTSRRAFEPSEHPWVGHDPKLAALLDDCLDKRRKLKQRTLWVDSLPPLDDTAIKRMKKEYSLDVGKTGSFPTDVRLTAAF